MLTGWQQSSLKHLRHRFQEAAREWPAVRHRLFVNDREGTGKGNGPNIPFREGLGGGGGHIHNFWVTEEFPRVWWYCEFGGATGGRPASSSFWPPAKDAGQIVRDQVLDALDLNGLDVRDDDLWTITLYNLAWRDLPGCPLRAFCEIVSDEAYHEIPTGDAHNELLGLRSELRIDPFTASAYAIDLILDPAVDLRSLLDPSDGLTPCERAVLLALHFEEHLQAKEVYAVAEQVVMSASLPDRRLSQLETDDLKKVGRLLSKLKKRGLVKTKSGNNGGTWLEDKGKSWVQTFLRSVQGSWNGTLVKKKSSRRPSKHPREVSS